MSKPKTYSDLAWRIGVVIHEPNIESAPLYAAQDRLFVRERRVTRSGIHDFLMLVAHSETKNLNPSWYRKWRACQVARNYAKIAKVNLPPSVWDEDKAQLAAALARPEYLSYSEELESEKRRALRWTKRRSTTAKS